MLHWGTAYFDLVRGSYTTPYTINFDVREDLTGNRYSQDDPVISDYFALVTNIVTTDEAGLSTTLPDVKLAAGESGELDVGCTAMAYNQYDVVPKSDHLRVDIGREPDGTPIYETLTVEEYKSRFAPVRPIQFPRENTTTSFGSPDDFNELSHNHTLTFAGEAETNRCRLTYSLGYESDNSEWVAPATSRLVSVSTVDLKEGAFENRLTVSDRDEHLSLQKPVFISGHLFLDQDGNGTRGDDETVGLEGIKIFGAGDVLETDANGNFAAQTTRPRHLTLDPRFPFIDSVPKYGLTTDTRAAPGDATELQFEIGAFEHATAQGMVFHDMNANGTQDSGEPPLEDVTVFFDSNHNGHRDGGLSICFPQLANHEYCQVTDADGNFDLRGGNFGDDFAIEAKLDNAFLYLTERDPIRVEANGQAFDNLRIGLAKGINLAGRVYDDAAGNGTYDHGPDARRVGVDVMLDLGNDGTVDHTFQTDSQGIYSFPQVVKGNHRVFIDLGSAETLTQPTNQQGYLITYDQERVQAELDFGIQEGIAVNSTGNARDSDTSDGRCDTGGQVDGKPECTLRAAIEQANADTTLNSISFGIPGDGPHRIMVIGDPLPTLTRPVNILGYSQPGSNRGQRSEDTNERTEPTITVGVDGAGTIGKGLVLQGGDSLVEGLSIYGFAGAALELNTGDRNNVLGNFIGLHSNTACVSCIGSAVGIRIVDSSENEIGGGGPSGPNYISHNQGPGIVVQSGSSNAFAENSIYQNQGIGIDLGGDRVTPNDRIDLDGGANDLLNFPTIHLISRHKQFGKSNKTEVSGSLTNIPNTLYLVDFYATKTDEAERIEHGIQGQRHLGAIPVQVEDKGFVHFRTDELRGTDDDEVITATVTDPFGNTSEFSHFTPDFTVDRGATTLDIRTPVLVVPGFFGSLPDALPGRRNPLGTYAKFITSHGAHPSELAMEPVTRGYDDLLANLKKAGYEEGKDLWAAPYDWRLPLAPSSVPGSSLDQEVDGLIDGVAAGPGKLGVDITDESFLYGIDYLGHWLRQVAEQWYATHGQPLPSVHIISHSMGGVLSRSYIQSLAYGETFQTSVQPGKTVNLALPMVESFTMFGVPNQGSPVVFPAWYDDFSSSTSYVVVLSKVILHGWLKLLAGYQLNIVDQGVDRSLSLSEFEGLSEIEKKQKFARLYVPGMRDLQPSYPGVFSNFFQPDDDAGSKLLEDLNVMDDGVTRLGARVGHTLALYGTDLATSYLLEARSGPDTDRRYAPILLGDVNVERRSINPFDSLPGRVPEAGEIWYEDFVRAAHGDGTVPIESLQGLFVDDASIERVLYCNLNCIGAFEEGQTALTPSEEDVSHTGLPYNRDAQLRVLQNLHHPLPRSVISNDMHLGTFDVLGTVFGFNKPEFHHKIITNDPVNALLIDAEGRRLGYTEETGPLAEIPGSVYLGDADGIGWIFGSAEEARPPYTLRILGQEEDYVVQVTSIAGNAMDGVLQQGNLATGETLDIPVPEVESKFSVDIDGDGYTDPLTDGILLKRYMEGLQGEPLVAGAVGVDAIRQSPVEIESYLAAAGLAAFEIDNNGSTSSDSDGELIQRGMLGFHGGVLIEGALGADADRSDTAEVLEYLYQGLLTGNRLLPSPGDQKQYVTHDFSGQPVAQGETASLRVKYSAEAGESVASGLAFRLHFDSRQLDVDVSELLVPGGIQQVFDDSHNFDNDIRTDKFIQLFWSETNGAWLNGTTDVTDLLTAEFGSADTFVGAAIKFTAASLTPGFTLDAEPIEIPSTLPIDSDWQNQLNRLDVNYDQVVSPFDVLHIINDLNSSGSRALPARSLANAVPPYIDTSGDNSASPQDALIVINFLNSDSNRILAEGEAATFTLRLDTLFQQENLYSARSARSREAAPLLGSRESQPIPPAVQGDVERSTSVDAVMETEWEEFDSLSVAVDSLILRLPPFWEAG